MRLLCSIICILRSIVDGLSADNNSSFSLEIFDIAMTEIESIVEPDSVGNDTWWEAVTFVGTHRPILTVMTR